MVQIRFFLSRFLKSGIRGFLLGLLFMAGAQVAGQTDVGNFKVPDIDENGIMVSMMTGESARMYPGKPMEITNLAMEFYEPDGQTVKLKVTSPFCVYNAKTNSATSEDKVKIEGPKFTITGTGYIFEATHSRMEIQSDVKVLLKNLDIKTPKNEK